MNKYTHIYIYHVHTSVYMHVHTHIYIYTLGYTVTHTYKQHINIYIYICVYIYIYIHRYRHIFIYICTLIICMHYIQVFSQGMSGERERRSEKRFPYPKHSLINTSRNIWAQNFNLKTYHHGCVAGAAMLHAGCLYYGLRSAAIDVLGIKTMNHCWFSLGC